VQVNE
jgi:hypothetical protein